MSEKTRRLFRYTSLASALDIVQSGKLTLLSYEDWLDKNDSTFMRVHQKECRLETLRALCFTEAPETSHHWQVYAPGQDGVRIEFDYDLLDRAISVDEHARFVKVDYEYIDNLEGTMTQRDLAGLKRWPYRGEEEVRIVYEARHALDGPAQLSSLKGAIYRVVLSPVLPMPLVGAVSDALNAASRLGELEIARSGLFYTKNWVKRIVDRL